MKAISLWQPWATAVARGSKRIETRSWQTKYRGPLAIHAAKRKNMVEFRDYASSWNWCGALGRQMAFGLPLGEALPFGAIVATCRLVDCVPTEEMPLWELDTIRRPEGESEDNRYIWTERDMGDFRPGRYAWILEDVAPLSPAAPYRGRQGLFNIPGLERPKGEG